MGRVHLKVFVSVLFLFVGSFSSTDCWSAKKLREFDSSALTVLGIKAVVEKELDSYDGNRALEAIAALEQYSDKLVYIDEPDDIGMYNIYFLDRAYRPLNGLDNELDIPFQGYGLMMGDDGEVAVYAKYEKFVSVSDPRTLPTEDNLETYHANQMEALATALKERGIDPRMSRRRLNVAEAEHRRKMKGYENNRRSSISRIKAEEYGEYLGFKEQASPARWFFEAVKESIYSKYIGESGSRLVNPKNPKYALALNAIDAVLPGLLLESGISRLPADKSGFVILIDDQRQNDKEPPNEIQGKAYIAFLNGVRQHLISLQLKFFKSDKKRWEAVAAPDLSGAVTVDTQLNGQRRLDFELATRRGLLLEKVSLACEAALEGSRF